MIIASNFLEKIDYKGLVNYILVFNKVSELPNIISSL